MTDEELVGLFAGLERRLEERFDGFDLHLDRCIARLRGGLEGGFGGLEARLQKLEDTLVAEFRKWTFPAEEPHFRDHGGNPRSKNCGPAPRL